MNVHDRDAASRQKAVATPFKARRENFGAPNRRMACGERRPPFSGTRTRRSQGRGRRRLAVIALLTERYVVAPTARASCRQGESHGNVRGMWSTIRRAERSTQTASLSSRSRSVVTWASAQLVPAARRRNSQLQSTKRRLVSAASRRWA